MKYKSRIHAGFMTCGFYPADYCDLEIMYSMELFNSAIEHELQEPFGGIDPLPLVAEATSASIPSAILGDQAALSPSLGDSASPVA